MLPKNPKNKNLLIRKAILNFLFITLFSYSIFSDELTYDFSQNNTLKSYQLSKEQYYTPPPSNKNNNSLLPLCFIVHMLDKVSLLLTGYIIIESGLTLKSNLDEINPTAIWQVPFAWMQKLQCYSSCFYTVGMAALKVIIARYGTKLLINHTCPNELKKLSTKSSKTNL